MNNQDNKFSQAETCVLMEPMHANVHGHVHGGELMRLMDNTAGIAAAKHAKGAVVTARVDELEFHSPVLIGDIVTCIAQLCYVGNSSMQIWVSVYVNNLSDASEMKLALSAFFTMVHLKDKVVAQVEPLQPSSDLEHKLYALGEAKYLEIKAKRKKQ